MAGRRLKVFQAQFGFFDTVVAVASRAAALRAWGTHQNLFASGEAIETQDEAAVAAALKHPETPLRRAVGSNDPFQLEPSRLPQVPDAPKRAQAGPSGKAKLATAKKPPADRNPLDAAEAALRRLEDARKREEADFRRRQDELDAAKTKAQCAYVEARKTAAAAVAEAGEAFRRAGGEP